MTSLGSTSELAGDVSVSLLVAPVPLTMDLAILRYRLYDIDRLINRTLVYGLLTVLLGAIYAIQQTVDRRFNRRKYNAVKTVEVFSAHLRDEVDLDTLSTELLALVDETVQPTRSSLWLRPTGQGSQHTAR